MSRLAPLLAIALLATALASPTTAAQLPDNPFDDAFACAPPDGTGVVGFARAMVWLACFAVVFTGYNAYELVCTVSGAC